MRNGGRTRPNHHGRFSPSRIILTKMSDIPLVATAMSELERPFWSLPSPLSLYTLSSYIPADTQPCFWLCFLFQPLEDSFDKENDASPFGDFIACPCWDNSLCFTRRDRSQTFFPVPDLSRTRARLISEGHRSLPDSSLVLLPLLPVGGGADFQCCSSRGDSRFQSI